MVDGIPVNWIDAGEPKMTAVLSFGVGYRDEEPHTVGLSHLVEHLAMRRTTGMAIPHNATTDVDGLQFFGAGDAQQIVAFLELVCAGIRDLRHLPEDVVTAEKGIVAAELARGGTAEPDGPFRHIYGLAGVGLAEFGQPGLRSFTAAMVASFAEKWMHSGNVLLTLTGPIPPGLRLDLPPGASIARGPHPPPRPPQLPCWIPWVDGAPLTLTVVSSGSWAPRVLATAALEKSLFNQLRTHLGLIYSTSTWSTRLDSNYATARIVLDPEQTNVERVMIEATAVVRHLAEVGADVALLNEVRTSTLESLSSKEAAAPWLLHQATNLVRGWPSRSIDNAIDSLRSVTRDELLAVWREFARYLVVTTRTGHISATAIEQLSLTPFTWVPHKPNISVRGVFADVLSNAATLLDPVRGEADLKGHQLHITPQHITVLNTMNEVTIQVAIDDVVLMRRYSDGLLWFDFTSGLVAWLRPSSWKDPKNVIGSTLARIPAHCVIAGD